MKRPIRILISDSHAMFREALCCLLETEPDITVVGEASTSREAVEQVRRLQPDILLLDLTLPESGGMETLGALSREDHLVHTLVIVDHDTDGTVVEALKYGARGIVAKRTSPALLFKSIRTVFGGDYWVGHDNIPHLVAHIREGQTPRRSGVRLTARELEIVTSIVDGATNKDIAEKLSISEQTVKHHLTSVFAKVGVSNRLELALFAMRGSKA